MRDDPDHPSGRAYAAVAFSVLAWAGAFPVIAFCLTEVKPIPLAALRFGLAGLIALGWLAWKRPGLPSGPHLLRFAVCGLLGFTLYSALINLGQVTVSAGAASFITNIIPILTALLAWLLLGERFTRLGWLGCLLGFAGVSVIALGQPGGLSFGAGATFILAASLCSAASFVLQKPLVSLYGALPCTAYTLAFAGLFLLPWMAEAAGQVLTASPAVTLSVLGLALFPTLLAYLAWTYALGRLPAGVAANFIYLVAPLAAALAFAFLGERPLMATLAGGGLAVSGTILVARWGRGVCE